MYAKLRVSNLNNKYIIQSVAKQKTGMIRLLNTDCNVTGLLFINGQLNSSQSPLLRQYLFVL